MPSSNTVLISKKSCSLNSSYYDCKSKGLMLSIWSQWGLLRVHPIKAALAHAETGISMCARSGC